MPEMTIRLRRDPATGKQDIVISLSADADSLPHEHEQQHKALVEKLIHGGLLKPAEVGQIVVEREEEKKGQTPAAQAESEPERRSLAEGS
jgi:hypothetical protein